MKTFVWIFSLLMLASPAVQADEPLRSERAKRAACSFMEAYYEELGRSDLLEYGIRIEAAACMSEMSALITQVEKQRIGSREFTRAMGLKFQSEEYTCALDVERDIDLFLNEDDEPVITFGEWKAAAGDLPVCYINAPRELVRIELGDERLEVTSWEALPEGFYIPDWVELGEPDDGAYGMDYSPFVLKNDAGETLGYVVEYWYANSEDEYSHRYTLKYTAQGRLLGNLIDEPEVFDLEDFPDWEDE